MKKYKIAFLIVLSLLLMNCSEDDSTNTAPSITSQTFNIPEDTPIGTIIGTIEASDSDGDQLTFNVLSGNIDDTFTVDSSTGEITLIGMLEFDNVDSYVFEIEVTDGQLNSSSTITIQIIEGIETGLKEKTIMHDGIERKYLLYLPEDYTGNEALPLVFSLHGAGGSKESQYALSEFNLLAESENFILVTPEALAVVGNIRIWNQQSSPNAADDVGYIDALIDEVSSDYNVDLDRIYIAGSSNGAFMALEIACKLSEKIAAVAAVKGYMSPEQIANCNPTTPTAIIQMHGTNDPLVTYESVEVTIQFWNTFNNTNSTAIVSTRPDLDPNNGNVTNSYLYSDGTNGFEVEHLEVINGVHDWFGEPGTNYDINASEEAWIFFKKFNINGKI
ncbi:hypothetical protein FJ651_09290 [Paucihalobacter ruber]|uniref:Cadherin domain-containing protein n=1 Tax=Paucihalobacter ruber TaxID=2567861 RepID=A0A506PIB8_9FLAO|nr:cadherin domain-containing protein [Paucihalobacter ruber]TPV33278.1 hypothetical protein FJ651_09290 [Paucihalobacter ruber]